MKKTILLTGATGFIGVYVLNKLLERGFKVKALRRDRKLKKQKLSNKLIWIKKDYLDLKSEDFLDIDLIIHLAAHSANTPYDNLINCLEYNLMQPLKMLEQSRIGGVNKFLIIGSCFEYGESGINYDFI